MRKARTRLWSVLLTCAMLLALLPTAALAVETDTAENDWFVMQDFGEWGEGYPDYVNVGWQYPEEFNTFNIIAIEVGLKDAAGQLIVKYTADTETVVQSSEYNSNGKNQIAFQTANGYINSNRQSSAPFYQSIAIAEDGKLMAEVKGEDWTVIPGEADVFFAWEPTTAYVKVTTKDGTQEKENESFTGSVSSAYVAKVDDKYYSTLKDAFAAVAQSEDKTVTLTADVVVSDAEHMGGYGTAIINVPAGVTLDGAGYSIIAQNWNSENQYHIIGVSETDADTITTIQNLTIAGNANTKSGIHAYKCVGTVAISGVTIMDCGNAAVQVNGSIVTAENLTTSGNAWGAVNVDKGSNVTTETSFTLSGNENSLSEPVKVWTELTDEEAIITVPESWAQVSGSGSNAYAPAEALTENVVYNESTKTYYQSLELAVKQAQADDVLAVYPGNYNIQQDNATTVEGQTGWYLPIDKSLTIKGVDANGNEITDASATAANIYSTDYSANGAWATQNLITVLADDVIISGLTIMNKVAANKAVEVMGTASDFTIQNCTFAPISEELLEGLNGEELGGYVYEEYKEYGASLYFNGNVTGAKVESNYFDHSGISLDSTNEASISVTGNIFEGVKNWNNNASYTYSAIGYTSWTTPEVTNITDAKLTIKRNQFINAGKVNFTKVTEGSVNVSENYWEGMDLSSDVTGSATVSTIYIDKEMTQLVTVSAEEQTLQEILNAAESGSVIDLAGKYWPGDLKITTPVILKNGYVDTVTAIGDLDGLTFENITFRGVSNAVNLDTNASALYLQGKTKMTNVLVDGCEFVGPAFDETTIAITTLNVDGLTVKDSAVDGYTISAYHNPGNGGNITYQNNNFKNIQSGIGFIATDGITVTGNTFENANGIRLEPSWSDASDTCTEIAISENKFLSTPENGYAVRVQNSTGTAGVADNVTVTLDRNYWGSANPDFDKLILAPEGVTVDSDVYYVDEAMTRLNTDSTGGGSSGGSSSYTISIEDTGNGSISVSPSRASYGQTVTITATPDEGYALAAITLTDKNGDEIKLTKVSDTKYTFTMPRGTVKIAATFAEEEVVSALPFNDVDVDDWFYNAVKYAYDNGMMGGVGNSLFAPDSDLNRAMMVQILWNLEGNPNASTTTAYSDVASNAWYYNAVQWAAAEGIAGGYGDGIYGPEDNITREQMALMLYRYAQYKSYDTTQSGADVQAFSDYEEISDWALEGMTWAVSAGLLGGKGDGVLDPTGNATRAEVAQILMNFCENIVK